VEEIAKLVTANNLSKTSVQKIFDENKFEMGIKNDDDFKPIQLPADKCIEVRNEQAKLLEGLTTNFSPALFIQVKQASQQLQQGIQDLSSYVFTNLCLRKPWNNSQKKIEIDDKWVRDLWGIDLFELQNEFKEKVIQPLLNKIFPAASIAPDKENNPNPNAHMATFTAVGAVIGMALSACIFKASPMTIGKALSCCFLPSNITSAIITGGALGATLGISASYSDTFMGRE
jgi:hypothetical protein